MPYRAKKPCSMGGCRELTDGRYCETHQKEENQRYEKYKRNPETKKRYGSTWRKIRDLYVRTHPFCEICLQNNKFTPVEEVHHRVPLTQGGTNEFANLQSLCKSCHSRTSALEGDRWKGGQNNELR